MVVIGHSMGGCISRLLITDARDQLWMKLFNKPPAQVSLPPESRKLFTDASSSSTAQRSGASSSSPRRFAAANSRVTGLAGCDRA
jgi:hypothetical protein